MHDDKFLIEEKALEGKLAFEQARFEYCEAIYEKELKRKERLDRKTEFYFSFVTLFLGAIFLNIGFLSQLRDLILNTSPTSGLPTLVYVSIVTLAIALLCSLFSILGSIQVRRYTNPYPKEATSALFESQSAYLDREDSESLLKANALSYAIAVEDNKKANDRKAAWMRMASVGAFTAVMSLVAILAAVAGLALF